MSNLILNTLLLNSSGSPDPNDRSIFGDYEIEVEENRKTPLIGLHKFTNVNLYNQEMANKPVLLMEAYTDNEQNDAQLWEYSRKLITHYNPMRLGNYWPANARVTIYVRYCHPLTDMHKFRGIRLQNYRYPSANCYYVFSEWKDAGLVPVESVVEAKVEAMKRKGFVWLLAV